MREKTRRGFVWQICRLNDGAAEHGGLCECLSMLDDLGFDERKRISGVLVGAMATERIRC